LKTTFYVAARAIWTGIGGILYRSIRTMWPAISVLRQNEACDECLFLEPHLGAGRPTKLFNAAVGTARYGAEPPRVHLRQDDASIGRQCLHFDPAALRWPMLEQRVARNIWCGAVGADRGATILHTTKSRVS